MNREAPILTLWVVAVVGLFGPPRLPVFGSVWRVSMSLSSLPLIRVPVCAFEGRVPVTREVVSRAMSEGGITGLHCLRSAPDPIRRPISRVCVERVPVTPAFVRVPITKERLAVAVSGNFSCNKPHCACQAFNLRSLLHSSIERLVAQHARGYATTICEDPADLVNECFQAILKKLHGYNPQKSMFSTWVWKVCKSVLNAIYHQRKRHRERVMYVEPNSYPSAARTEHSTLAADMRTVISLALTEFPERRDVVLAMFGNPDSEQFEMPARVCVAQAARSVGLPYGEVYGFYKGQVIPFMQDCLT